MPPIFPIPQSTRIDTQPFRHFPLGQSELPARRAKPFGQRFSGSEGVVAEEPDDGRHAADDRGGCVAFPVRDGGSGNADLVANLPLEEFEVEATGADVAA